MLSRLFLIAGALAFGLALSACAKSDVPVDAAGNPLEELKVVTSSGEHELWVEIADDEPERERGLMYRPPLADDRGMLFEFPDSAERSFWMRNTPSSLDIIYIDGTGKIVSIAHHATPYSEAPLPSNGAATGVLEVRAGLTEQIGAKPGDTIVHPFFKP
ncbi:DUF192 domain-containing protein [Brevundimonas sp. NIBR11]|uniref:DUF192 domain-containing protein n=1 Tax=Brevundimonas sp. NIBR11 TaxID=3015999 RepID=UPI0022F08540|nr:DUF192 domain-containing protein [Brevundimonas sp. NIBR11]WGM31082.1 hypothetical protein KKHFBJBL_01320 [Brevundimonas sp. NIBR11]